jgi:hypothetical protein
MLFYNPKIVSRERAEKHVGRKGGDPMVRLGSTPVMENSEPNFRKGSKAVIGHGR